MEILRNLNLKSSSLNSEFTIYNLLFGILSVLVLALGIAACSKKPAELFDDGIKSFAAGKYSDAEEQFADGIKKNGSDSLYAGFIAANLVTGKYPQLNSSYNQFTDGIRTSLVLLYGERALRHYGITSKIVPYKTEGGNQLPPDFPLVVVVQARADIQDFFTIKQQIDKLIKK